MLIWLLNERKVKKSLEKEVRGIHFQEAGFHLKLYK
jgi:hypothetical protein